jgi:hypothetical protein
MSTRPAGMSASAPAGCHDPCVNGPTWHCALRGEPAYWRDR